MNDKILTSASEKEGVNSARKKACITPRIGFVEVTLGQYG